MGHVQAIDGIPRLKPRRWTKLLATAIAALALLVGIGFATGLIRVYSGPRNAGVTIGVECHDLGFEWRGDPGLFADSCS